ncbi:Shoulder domain [Phytophthora cactorum]|nr:Shoulder domain [Phytophthora cactorum]
MAVPRDPPTALQVRARAGHQLQCSRVLAGPLTYTRQEHEHVITPPQNMIVLPAQQYVEVRNPVVRSEDGKIVRDAFDQAKLKHGEIEFRIFDKYPEPFPLYPGEEQVGEIRELRVVPVDTALRIRATRKTDKYVAGDEWLFVGPATYYPRFRAEKKCTDSQAIERDAGEEWLVRTPGAYLPQIDEVHVETLQAHVLTQDTALHLRALRTFKDVYGISRRAGEEWLITTETTETHVQDVHEEIIGYVNATILTNRQYCIVVDPVVNGVQHRGTRELRKGEASFFLQPGEQLENGRVEDIVVLADDEAVLLQAVEPFVEHSDQEEGEPEGEDSESSTKKKLNGVRREAGERWMVHGPREYIPPIQVKVLETRRAIPLDVNEGVYVRERKTGHVRAVKGETYMLQATEELWSKYLSPAVEELLSSQVGGSAPWDTSKGAPRKRDPTRVVTFEVPHNAGIQVYDYKTTSSRILFGPTLVMLEPDEQFTVLRLSGGVPKEPNVIRTLCLQLGPDFMRDQIIVETSDHARLSLTIAYNWRFRVDSSKPADAAKVFNVKDFTGDACKTLASRIRGAVAVQNFDHFHKHSAQIIRTSIFGLDENNKLRDELIFPANNLCITNKSVQLAIEITTKSQEARAKAIAMKEEEAAKGELLTQQLENQSSAEQARKNLVQLRAECKAVEEEAAAVSRARAQAQAAEIEGQAAVRQAELRAKAERIEHEAHVASIKEDQTLSVAHAEQLAKVEVHKKRELMAIEAEKFQQMVSSVGQETLVALARAGPDGQVKMLEALGLSGYLITDGKSPVNLLGTARGSFEASRSRSSDRHPIGNGCKMCHVLGVRWARTGFAIFSRRATWNYARSPLQYTISIRSMKRESWPDSCRLTGVRHCERNSAFGSLSAYKDLQSPIYQHLQLSLAAKKRFVLASLAVSTRLHSRHQAARTKYSRSRIVHCECSDQTQRRAFDAALQVARPCSTRPVDSGPPRMSDNWRLDVKFQGRSIDLVGRLPAEKRSLLREFPRRLAVGTKAKLSAIPQKGFFCKFFAKNCEEMKVYMKKHECALCVQFVASTFNFTLYLLVPVALKGLKCLHRLRKSGASPDSLKSLCTDRDGVVIGFIVSEVNVEMEEKLHERMKVMEELESTAKAISDTFGTQCWSLTCLLTSWIRSHRRFRLFQVHCTASALARCYLSETSADDGCDAVLKARASIVYVVHDVVKSVRANFPQKERNVKMRESALVLSLEKILFQLAQKLLGDAKHNPNVRAVFEFWTKWGLQYSAPLEDEDASKYDPILKIDETFEMLEREVSLVSDASSSPVKPSAPPEVVAFMKKHSIQPGPWEIYLGRASPQELEELDAVLDLNTKYFGFNNWDSSEKGGRRGGEMFLHHYTKSIMPWLLHASTSNSSSGKRKRAKDSLALLRDAFLCTWDLDPTAARAVSDIDQFLLDDMWKKWSSQVSEPLGVCIWEEICHRCRHHMVANPSVHMVKLCQKILATKNPMKAYSSAMKSMISRQMKISMFDKEAKKKRKLESISASSSPVTESEASSSPHSELTDAELAAVKRRIPKPPKLLFKKVDLKTITYQETNDNGTVGVAVSGIPNAGRGLFNLSDHPWPAFSVVCIFGVRRITKEMHHDGLNKVARCGELGETFVVVNGTVRDVDKFQTQYGHRLMPFDGLVDADGSVGGFPNDRVYEYPADVYWDASGFYNNCILVPGCVIENPQDTTSPIVLNQLYIVTWKEVAVREEFFLAYGTSYYEDDEKTSTTSEGSSN